MTWPNDNLDPFSQALARTRAVLASGPALPRSPSVFPQFPQNDMGPMGPMNGGGMPLGMVPEPFQPPSPPPQPIQPEPDPTLPQPEPDEPGLLSQIGDYLDRPGNAVRSLLAGRPLDALRSAASIPLPFVSKALGVYDPAKNHTSGQDVNKALFGVEPNNDFFSGAGLAGFATELATDPLNLVGIGELTEAGKAAKLIAGHLGEANDAAEAGLRGWNNLVSSANTAMQNTGKVAPEIEQVLAGGKTKYLAEAVDHHPVLGNLFDPNGERVPATELVQRLTQGSGPVSDAAQAVLSNAQKLGIGEEAFTPGATATERAQRGQQALIQAGGAYEPGGLFNLPAVAIGKYSPGNYIPGIGKPLFETGKTALVQGAPVLEAMEKAGNAVRDIPGVKQISDLFEKTFPLVGRSPAAKEAILKIANAEQQARGEAGIGEMDARARAAQRQEALNAAERGTGNVAPGDTGEAVNGGGAGPVPEPFTGDSGTARNQKTGGIELPSDEQTAANLEAIKQRNAAEDAANEARQAAEEAKAATARLPLSGNAAEVKEPTEIPAVKTPFEEVMDATANTEMERGSPAGNAGTGEVGTVAASTPGLEPSSATAGGDEQNVGGVRGDTRAAPMTRAEKKADLKDFQRQVEAQAAPEPTPDMPKAGAKVTYTDYSNPKKPQQVEGTFIGEHPDAPGVWQVDIGQGGVKMRSKAAPVGFISPDQGRVQNITPSQLVPNAALEGGKARRAQVEALKETDPLVAKHATAARQALTLIPENFTALTNTEALGNNHGFSTAGTRNKNVDLGKMLIDEAAKVPGAAGVESQANAFPNIWEKSADAIASGQMNMPPKPPKGMALTDVKPGDELTLRGRTWKAEDVDADGKVVIKDDDLGPNAYPPGLVPIDEGTEVKRMQGPFERRAAGPRTGNPFEDIAHEGTKGISPEGVEGSPGAAAVPSAANAFEPPHEALRAQVPVFITKDQRQQLYDRGFTRKEVDAMRPEDAQRRLNDVPHSEVDPQKLEKAREALRKAEEKEGLPPTKLEAKTPFEEVGSAREAEGAGGKVAEQEVLHEPAGPVSEAENSNPNPVRREGERRLTDQFEEEQKPLMERRLAGDRRVIISNPHDVTGLVSGEDARNRILDMALESAKETGEPVAHAEGDLRNLGGLNDKFGGKAGANPHLQAMADIIKKQTDKLPDAVLLHHGGDEFSVVARGSKEEDLRAALQAADPELQAYIKEHGLDQILHSKFDPSGKRKLGGTGFNFATDEFNPEGGATRAQMVKHADSVLEDLKKGYENEHTVAIGKTGAEPSGESAGQAARGIEEERGRVPQGESEPRAEIPEAVRAEAERNTEPVAGGERGNGERESGESGSVTPPPFEPGFGRTEVNKPSPAAAANIEALEKRQAELRAKGEAEKWRKGETLDAARQTDDALRNARTQEDLKTHLAREGMALDEASRRAAEVASGLSPEASKALSDHIELGKPVAPVVKAIGDDIKAETEMELAMEKGIGTKELQSEREGFGYMAHVGTEAGERFHTKMQKNFEKQGAPYYADLERKRIELGLRPDPEALKRGSEQRAKMLADGSLQQREVRKLPKGLQGEATNRLLRMDPKTRDFIVSNPGMLKEYLDYAKEISNSHPSQIPRMPAYRDLAASEINEIAARHGAKGDVVNTNAVQAKYVRTLRHIKAMSGASFFDKVSEMGHALPNREGISIPQRPGVERIGDKFGVEEMNRQRAARGLPPIGFDDPDVASAIANVHKRMTEPDSAGKLLNWYDKYTRVMKMWLLGFPARVVRDHMMNHVQGWLLNVPLEGEHYQVGRKLAAGKDFSFKTGDGLTLNRDAMMREGVRAGMTGDGLFENVVKQGAAGATPGGSKWNPFNSENHFTEAGTKAGAMLAAGPQHLLEGTGGAGKLDYGMMEAGDRWGQYAYWRKQGYSPTAAAKEVKTALFDYSKNSMSDFEKNVMNRAAFFYGYTRNVIPMMLEAAKRNPARVAAIARLGNQPGKPEHLPSYAREGLSIPLGKDTEGNSKVLSNVSTPLESAVGPFAGFAESPRRGIEGLLSELNPIPRGLIEAGTGHDMFLGKQIEDLRTAPHWAADLPEPIRRSLGVVDIPTKSGGTREEADPWALWALRNSPAARISSTLSRATDERKTPAEIAANLTTGAHVISVNDEEEAARAQKEAIRNRLVELGRQGKGAFQYTRFAQDKNQPKDDEVTHLLKALAGK